MRWEVSTLLLSRSSDGLQLSLRESCEEDMGDSGWGPPSATEMTRDASGGSAQELGKVASPGAKLMLPAGDPSRP